MKLGRTLEHALAHAFLTVFCCLTLYPVLVVVKTAESVLLPSP